MREAGRSVSVWDYTKVGDLPLFALSSRGVGCDSWPQLLQFASFVACSGATLWVRLNSHIYCSEEGYK